MSSIGKSSCHSASLSWSSSPYRTFHVCTGVELGLNWRRDVDVILPLYALSSNCFVTLYFRMVFGSIGEGNVLISLWLSDVSIVHNAVQCVSLVSAACSTSGQVLRGLDVGACPGTSPCSRIDWVAAAVNAYA